MRNGYQWVKRPVTYGPGWEWAYAYVVTYPSGVTFIHYVSP